MESRKHSAIQNMLLAQLVICSFAVHSCGTKEAPEVKVERVSISQSTLSLTEGETALLTATVYPDNANNKAVSWSSSNAEVAIVSGGTVKAVSPGMATITATTADGGKTASCTVTVSARVIPVTSVALNQTSVSLKVGETVTLTAEVKPDNATDKTVSWGTSDASVAVVSEGLVTAIKAGAVKITAKAGDKEAACDITVSAVPVVSLTLNQTAASLKVGETISLTAEVKPDDATDKTVTWRTSDASVATVADGVVTALKLGGATITAKAGDKVATCEVTVVATPVTSVTMSQPTSMLKVGESVTLFVEVEPEDATDKSVTWSTSDASIAAVADGVVTALKEGTARITAKVGNLEATCDVTIEAVPVSYVGISQTEATLRVGETVTITAEANPAEATYRTITWRTSDASVATVADGVVTALKIGTAIITAKAEDKEATCEITVVATPVASVTLSQTAASLKVGETVKLTAEVKPDNATDKTVSWSTSDASIATVTDGIVTAKKLGTAKISAKAGDMEAICDITVAETPVASVTLNKTSASLKVGETVTLTAEVNPNDATDKTVIWSSSDASVATVSGGVVTAIKEGTAWITATAGGKKNSCEITVVTTGSHDGTSEEDL